MERKTFGQKLQNFMGSYRGQVIMNYAYSWGAAVVIAGTLFKLTHLPYANLMLWIGMGTEVLVFFISAFDLPMPKTNAATPAASTPSPAPEAGEPAVTLPTPRGDAAPAAIPSPGITPEMTEATQAYLAQLNELTATLSRFTTQAESLSHEGEQMAALGRNLSGINAIYEMQLRSASAQIGTIDQVHEQTRKMARQIEELNAVYARMLQAVQVGNH
ncbi:MAG: gliding motility protein GldL [Prevotellaceae bacterium]|jgi:hypothetical protein|nr:gliding motility protein GldL [Prevotellaceae bacterium]